MNCDVEVPPVLIPQFDIKDRQLAVVPIARASGLFSVQFFEQRRSASATSSSRAAASRNDKPARRCRSCVMERRVQRSICLIVLIIVSNKRLHRICFACLNRLQHIAVAEQ